ncbi:ATP-binding protein [Sphaerisporangium sp. NPDC051017]|uniref:ATP-binding protein n=1 Tax=Sphaerisporangium sp. NPDC051017 TaxID=3154636 RepID=UPI00343B74CA
MIKAHSVAIASNESFSGWNKTFTEPRLYAALVDRLTYGGNIIETVNAVYQDGYAPTAEDFESCEHFVITLGIKSAEIQAKVEEPDWLRRRPSGRSA